MMLDKQLVRFAQECHRLDVDRWRLTLSNGHSLTVSAQHDEEFLAFDADTGVKLSEEKLAPLIDRSGELPGVVKFAVCRGSASIRLQAEFPLPEDSDSVADRVRSHLKGMRSALHQLHNGFSGELPGGTTCAEQKSNGQVACGALPDLLTEAGWQVYHERSGGMLLADLETGPQFLQAEVAYSGAGVRFRTTLYRNGASGEIAQQALCLYLLKANAALRYARAFFQREREGIAAGFEVRVDGEITPAEAGHALAALSVAGRHCAREMEILKDRAVAEIYRSARAILIKKQRSMKP